MTMSPLIPKQCILVVDDNPENIDLLSEVLRDDYRIRVATSGEKALKIAQSDNPPDLVLLDIMMPEMDGYQTMQRIREEPQHRRLPIIALTAKAMKGDREKCLEAGASDYLAKPVNTDQLMSALRMWLHR